MVYGRLNNSTETAGLQPPLIYIYINYFKRSQIITCIQHLKYMYINFKLKDDNI